MLNKITSHNGTSDGEDLNEIHNNVSDLIKESKDKITNLFGDNIDYRDRLNLLLNQPYIQQLTLDELKNNYRDYLGQLIKLNLFNAAELLEAFNFILNLLVKKESEK